MPQGTYPANNGANRRNFVQGIVDKFHISVLNAQSMQNIREKCTDPNLFSLIAVDEAHYYPAETWRQILEYFREAKLVFLTATPYRNDDAIFPAPIFRFTYYDASNAQPPMVKRFEFINVDGEDDSLIVRTILSKLTATSQAIVMCKNDTRANEIKSIFNGMTNNGDFAIVINTHQSQNSENIENFRNNMHKVAIVNNMLVEGFDHPNITVAAFFDRISVTSGKRKYAQFIGRAVRYIREQNGPQTAFIIAPRSFDLEKLHNRYMEDEDVDPNVNEEE